MTTREFKVGDIVDVFDRRDNACVARGAKILGIDEAKFPSLPEGKYAVLDCGFGCSVRCLELAVK